MKLTQYLFSTGEFAKLNGVNKRTLHYYNDIGLFCPKVTDKNGYHYYTCFQSAQLELILTFRRVGLSIEEIKRYVQSPSSASFQQIVADKKQIIDQTIEQLLASKAFLEQKADKLNLGLQAEHGKIELVDLPEQYLLLSKPIHTDCDEADFAVAAEFSQRVRSMFGLFDSLGSRIPLKEINNTNKRYDCFFAQGRPADQMYDIIRPSGTYLRAFCIGRWEKLCPIYEKILMFAKQHQLVLDEYAYEEGLNEVSIEKGDDYVTMITIQCHET